MSLLMVHEIYLKNLAGEIPKDYARTYLAKEDALSDLKDITGQDFGYNVRLWQIWINRNIDIFNAKYALFVKSK